MYTCVCVYIIRNDYAVNKLQSTHPTFDALSPTSPRSPHLCPAGQGPDADGSVSARSDRAASKDDLEVMGVMY